VVEAEGLPAEFEFKQHVNTLDWHRQAGAERITGLL
jgi:hypothetical protein